MWRVELTAGFIKELARLDKPLRLQVANLLEAVSQLDDPRSRGKGLTGELRSYWRYRIGDYRVIVDIQDDRVCILAITVGHRSRIYRA